MLHRLFVHVLVLWYTFLEFIVSLLRINRMDERKKSERFNEEPKANAKKRLCKETNVDVVCKNLD